MKSVYYITPRTMGVASWFIENFPIEKLATGSSGGAPVMVDRSVPEQEVLAAVQLWNDEVFKLHTSGENTAIPFIEYEYREVEDRVWKWNLGK